MRSPLALAALSGLAVTMACRPHTSTSTATPEPVTVATGQSTRAPLPSELAGTFTLVSIDGHGLPFAPEHPGRPANAPPSPEVLSSTIVIRANGTFIMSMSYRVQRNGAIEFFDRPFSGTAEPNPAGHQLKWDNAGITPMTVQGDRLTIDNHGMRFDYRRRGDRR